jgi:hypothetical protein
VVRRVRDLPILKTMDIFLAGCAWIVIGLIVTFGGFQLRVDPSRRVRR